MLKKILLSLLVVSSMSVFADECGADKANPKVCKDPLPAGSACKRDKICDSGKCDIPDGAEKGTCK